MSPLDLLIFIMPFIAGALYLTVSVCYLIKKDYAWALVWLAYCLANVGLVLIGLRELKA